MIDFLSHLGTFFLEHLVFAKFHPKVHMDGIYYLQQELGQFKT